jgi:hypothetical protein
MAATALTEFSWKPQPETAAFVEKLINEFLAGVPLLRRLAERMKTETGTRLVDWIDHLAIPEPSVTVAELETVGYRPEENSVWRSPAGMFPPIRLHQGATRRLALRVESVADFLLASGLFESAAVEGVAGDAVRRARLVEQNGFELWVIERHGTDRIDEPADGAPSLDLIALHHEAFRLRWRRFDDDAQGFEQAENLIRAAIEDVGRDRACALFFAAERDYWQSRNRAARIQKSRQDALGLGWANHDHHTYRSSRERFSRMIGIFELLGFHCRERFYAGREAGWGAQVLEQPRAGVVIFADVDLSPEEVTADFAHEPLPVRNELGTVGLWCSLHGESFLQAGMHHLECQFDFDAVREQLRGFGIESMKPFTDLPYLKQAFTKGELWPVESWRIDRLAAAGLIKPEQAETFRTRGAIGSHLEILQRDEGYKGFNQTGINEIIRDTDPRRLMAAGDSHGH